MKNRNIFFGLFIALASAMLMLSCKKDEDNSTASKNTLTIENLEGTWDMNLQETHPDIFICPNLIKTVEDAEWAYIIISEDEIEAIAKLKPSPWSSDDFCSGKKFYSINDSEHLLIIENGQQSTFKYTLSNNGTKLVVTVLDAGLDPDYPNGAYEVYYKRGGSVDVKFWINAFIPRDIPGYTEIAPLSPPTTVIPYGFNPLFLYCALTDQRDFSSDENASHRMQSMVKLRIYDNGIVSVLHSTNDCDPSEEIICLTGAISCINTASTDNMTWDFSQISIGEISIKAAANNPCTFALGWSPNIDYIGTLKINTKNRTIKFKGKVDEFPAFEAYISINDENPHTQFQKFDNSKRVTDLFGDAIVDVEGDEINY